jgi:hypothetical protein
MRKFKFFISIILISTLSGCNDKQVNYKLVLVSNTLLSQNADDPLPSVVREALSPFECEANDLVFVPELSVYRSDLKDEDTYEIEVPVTPENKLRKKLGSYSYVDLKNDYEENLPSMKAGEFLSKKSTNIDPKVFKFNKENTLFLSIDKNLKDFSELKKKLDSTLCLQDENFSKKVIIFLNNSTEIFEGLLSPPETHIQGTTEPIIPPLTGNPCTQNTVTDGLDLKEDLMQIVDTKRTYKERDRLARETWKKYFDSVASVTFYVKANQKYPEGFFESGDGANYFIDRLAYMSSITNLNITRIEYHKDTHKISGIVIVECHNASEIQ